MHSLGAKVHSTVLYHFSECAPGGSSATILITYRNRIYYPIYLKQRWRKTSHQNICLSLFPGFITLRQTLTWYYRKMLLFYKVTISYKHKKRFVANRLKILLLDKSKSWAITLNTSITGAKSVPANPASKECSLNFLKKKKRSSGNVKRCQPYMSHRKYYKILA